MCPLKVYQAGMSQAPCHLPKAACLRWGDVWGNVSLCAAVQVHEGMMQAATFVHTNAYEALQAAAERFPRWPVMLTGHSMGGKSSESPIATVALQAMCQKVYL